LSISSCRGIKDISGLINNYSLTVNHCSNLKIFPKKVKCVIFEKTINTAGIDFPQLRKIHAIGAKSNYQFVAREKFQKLFKVRIFNSDVVRSLQGLKTVSVVELSSLQDLRDIEDLGENKFVYIFHCNVISSFSSLKNVPKVTILSCATFRDGYDVENVRYLGILYCKNFSNPNALGNVFDLTLAHYGTVESLVGLCNIPYLSVEVLDDASEQISHLIDSLGNENKQFTFPYWCYHTVKPALNKVVHKYHVVHEKRDARGCPRSVNFPRKVILLNRTQN
jgi:hypothetical protein